MFFRDWERKLKSMVLCNVDIGGDITHLHQIVVIISCLFLKPHIQIVRKVVVWHKPVEEIVPFFRFVDCLCYVIESSTVAWICQNEHAAIGIGDKWVLFGLKRRKGKLGSKQALKLACRRFLCAVYISWLSIDLCWAHTAHVLAIVEVFAFNELTDILVLLCTQFCQLQFISEVLLTLCSQVVDLTGWACTMAGDLENEFIFNHTYYYKV